MLGVIATARLMHQWTLTLTSLHPGLDLRLWAGGSGSGSGGGGSGGSTTQGSTDAMMSTSTILAIALSVGGVVVLAAVGCGVLGALRRRKSQRSMKQHIEISSVGFTENPVTVSEQGMRPKPIMPGARV